MSFSEKKRHFEKTNSSKLTTSNANTTTKSDGNEMTTNSHQTESVQQSYAESKRFSYLSQNELQKLREEEAKKLSTYTEEQLRSMMDAEQEEEEEEMDNFRENGTIIKEYNDSEETMESTENGQRRIFRTAKAERRYQKEMGFEPTIDDGQMTPTQRRALEAEKRKEWRQARLKSLEDDPTMTLLSMKNYDHWAEQINEDEVHWFWPFNQQSTYLLPFIFFLCLLMSRIFIIIIFILFYYFGRHAEYYLVS